MYHLRNSLYSFQSLLCSPRAGVPQGQQPQRVMPAAARGGQDGDEPHEAAAATHRPGHVDSHPLEDSDESRRGSKSTVSSSDRQAFVQLQARVATLEKHLAAAQRPCCIIS